MSEWIFSCLSSPADRPWSIYRHRPLSFHAHSPSLIPDITSHQNDCGCLLFPLMEPLLPLLLTIPVSAVNPFPVLQGLAEAFPPNPQGLLLLPSFLSFVNIPFLPLTLTWPHNQAPSPVFTYVNLLIPAEFWRQKLVGLGVWGDLSLIMPNKKFIWTEWNYWVCNKIQQANWSHKHTTIYKILLITDSITQGALLNTLFMRVYENIQYRMGKESKKEWIYVCV